jgi:preprotein translocase subunit SecF
MKMKDFAFTLLVYVYLISAVVGASWAVVSPDLADKLFGYTVLILTLGGLLFVLYYVAFRHRKIAIYVVPRRLEK